MAATYDLATIRRLQELARQCQLERSLRVERYESGDRRNYEMTGVWPAHRANVELEVERFVGGGFAGQVYRVKVLSVSPVQGDGGGQIDGLCPGGLYAMKILVPPSKFSRIFRDAMYFAGFGGPFSLQVNPNAERAAALWQKLIRRGAAIRFGDQQAVADVLASFVDHPIGSCGELLEWVDGRTWRFEVDDRLDWRRAAEANPKIPRSTLGSPEYRAKKNFMAEFVRLLHEMGAHELARQYEWWSAKSQPNCLKRRDRDDDPAAGLTAVDFKAGLALLPILPMSPVDFRLIVQGIARGSLVQFDRGDISALRQFTQQYSERFTNMAGAVDELERLDKLYRDSLPDITHHGLRIWYDRTLWRTILDSLPTAAAVRGDVDPDGEQRLRRSRWRTIIFAVVGLVPMLGRLRKLYGRSDYRRHFSRLFSDRQYFKAALRARAMENLISWHRKGSVSAAKAETLAAHLWRYFLHVPLSILPATLHRALTDSRFAAGALAYIFVRPLKLYFNADFRRQWLIDMIADGRKHGMLTDAEADRILLRVDEPYIQQYLKSLAVHLCCMPVTHVVAIIVGAIYWIQHPQQSFATNMAAAGLILLFFQVIPISPGSLTRGFYVVYLVIRDRSFRDYNIAVFLAFFKYIGYLAFPIQMAYRYPDLALFMAGHWATGAAHVVPVFGERGALLEHGVFDEFYNRPLTMRRRMRERDYLRQDEPKRRWHAWAFGLIGATWLAMIDMLRIALNMSAIRGQPHFVIRHVSPLPTLGQEWYQVVLIAMLAGIVTGLSAGSLRRTSRILLGTLCGAVMAVSFHAWRIAVDSMLDFPTDWATLAKSASMWTFLITLIATIGAIIEELSAPRDALFLRSGVPAGNAEPAELAEEPSAAIAASIPQGDPPSAE